MPPVEQTGKQTVLVDSADVPVSVPDYIAQRQASALRGQVYLPTLGYALVGNVGKGQKYPYNPFYGEWSPRVSFVTEGVERALELAKDAAGERVVSVCAANTAQQLLRAGLLDEIELSVVPCLLGSGVRLLDHLGPEPIELEQISVIPSDGVTHLRYRIVRS